MKPTPPPVPGPASVRPYPPQSGVQIGFIANRPPQQAADQAALSPVRDHHADFIRGYFVLQQRQDQLDHRLGLAAAANGGVAVAQIEEYRGE